MVYVNSQSPNQQPVKQSDQGFDSDSVQKRSGPANVVADLGLCWLQMAYLPFFLHCAWFDSFAPICFENVFAFVLHYLLCFYIHVYQYTGLLDYLV